MNKRDFKAKMIISPTIMVGDHGHNADIEGFMEGVKQSTLTRKVQGFIVEMYSGRWIHTTVSKGDLRILRSLCRAKSPKTVDKRKKMFIDLQMKSHYGALLNRSKIEKFMDMVI